MEKDSKLDSLIKTLVKKTLSANKDYILKELNSLPEEKANFVRQKVLKIVENELASRILKSTKTPSSSVGISSPRIKKRKSPNFARENIDGNIETDDGEELKNPTGKKVGRFVSETMNLFLPNHFLYFKKKKGAWRCPWEGRVRDSIQST